MNGTISSRLALNLERRKRTSDILEKNLTPGTNTPSIKAGATIGKKSKSK